MRRSPTHTSSTDSARCLSRSVRWYRRRRDGPVATWSASPSLDSKESCPIARSALSTARVHCSETDSGATLFSCFIVAHVTADAVGLFRSRHVILLIADAHRRPEGLSGPADACAEADRLSIATTRSRPRNAGSARSCGRTLGPSRSVRPSRGSHTGSRSVRHRDMSCGRNHESCLRPSCSSGTALPQRPGGSLRRLPHRRGRRRT
jgi:hypothetical protein